MFNSIIIAITALANAVAAHAKNGKIRELRLLRDEQAKLRIDIVNAVRNGNNELRSELQNQLDSSYADGEALRRSSDNEDK